MSESEKRKVEDLFYKWQSSLDWRDTPFRIAKLAYCAGYAQAEADVREAATCKDCNGTGVVDVGLSDIGMPYCSCTAGSAARNADIAWRRISGTQARG